MKAKAYLVKETDAAMLLTLDAGDKVGQWCPRSLISYCRKGPPLLGGLREITLELPDWKAKQLGFTPAD